LLQQQIPKIQLFLQANKLKENAQLFENAATWSKAELFSKMSDLLERSVTKQKSALLATIR